MNKQIFLNLPVADLSKSKTFFQALGYPLNPQFSGEGCACVVISETISAMLGTHAKFREFTSKAVCDTTQGWSPFFPGTSTKKTYSNPHHTCN
jgi:uncharacterized protein